MTGRQRLNAVVHGEPCNQLAWTTLVDGHTLDALPPAYRGCGGMDFYRRIGADIFLLNGWGTAHRFQSPALQWGPEVEVTGTNEDGDNVQRITTAAGRLHCRWKRNHPVKYLVETKEDLEVYHSLWAGARFVEKDDSEVMAALEAMVGADGIITRFWGPSAIPRLLETDMGTANFYYLLNDHPAEMDALIHLMHKRQLEAFEILAHCPCETVTLVENTSTLYISPQIYRRYNGPHVQAFVGIMRSADKIPIVHMCGHVRNLLPDIRETGLAGVHTLTPPPTGDTPWELALDALGEDQVIFGTLDPGLFELAPLPQLEEALDALITPRLRRANFVLTPMADGHRVPLERFQTVARWVERNGNRN